MLSDLIEQAQRLLKEHGDLPVQISVAEHYEGQVSDANSLIVGEIFISDQGTFRFKKGILPQ